MWQHPSSSAFFVMMWEAGHILIQLGCLRILVGKMFLSSVLRANGFLELGSLFVKYRWRNIYFFSFNYTAAFFSSSKTGSGSGFGNAFFISRLNNETASNRQRFGIVPVLRAFIVPSPDILIWWYIRLNHRYVLRWYLRNIFPSMQFLNSDDCGWYRYPRKFRCCGSLFIESGSGLFGESGPDPVFNDQEMGKIQCKKFLFSVILQNCF